MILFDILRMKRTFHNWWYVMKVLVLSEDNECLTLTLSVCLSLSLSRSLPVCVSVCLYRSLFRSFPLSSLLIRCALRPDVFLSRCRLENYGLEIWHRRRCDRRLGGPEAVSAHGQGVDDVGRGSGGHSPTPAQTPHVPADAIHVPREENFRLLWRWLAPRKKSGHIGLDVIKICKVFMTISSAIWRWTAEVISLWEAVTVHRRPLPSYPAIWVAMYISASAILTYWNVYLSVVALTNENVKPNSTYRHLPSIGRGSAVAGRTGNDRRSQNHDRDEGQMIRPTSIHRVGYIPACQG